MSLHELDTFPGVTAQPDAATANFVFNHTMLRVKDIARSVGGLATEVFEIRDSARKASDESRDEA